MQRNQDTPVRMIAAIFISLALLAMLELVFVAWLWDKVGFANMLLLVLGTGIVGALIARKNAREAFMVLLDGGMPSSKAAKQLFDAVAFFIAAVLLIIPGIISDIAGLMILLPLTRKLLFERYVRKIFPGFPTSGQHGDNGHAIDIKAEKMD